MAEASPKNVIGNHGVDAPAPTLAAAPTDRTLTLPRGVKPGAPEPVPSPAGSLLGPYELLELLGRGGMGSVWKARHTKLDKLVALKVLRPDFTADADAISRFEREMKAVGKLEHTHIVRAMDAGQAAGVHYLVMEYIEGIDLSRLVKNRGPRSVKEACQMIRHAALGLAHAHEHGLVHRDIKPSNLLLSKKGLVKILDLGLARLHSDRTADEASLTMQGELMGTPDYMAPEQWQSAHTAGAAADLYALGCTLFHLLTGRPPFADQEHSSFGQKMQAHLFETPPRLAVARTDVPAEVDGICQCLLAKDPAARPESAQKLADDLRALLRTWTQSPAPAETIAWPEPATGQRWLFLAKWKMEVILGGLVVAALAVAAVVFGLADRRQSVSPRPSARSVPITAETRPAPARAVAPFNAAQAKARQKAWAYYLGTPVEFTNSLGMKFCLIPPGEYERGTLPERLDDLLRKAAKSKVKLTADLEGSLKSEAPRHHVRILEPFYLAAHEVTQAQYVHLMATNPSHFSDTGKARDKVASRDRDRLPVDSITFENALEFCRIATQLESTDKSPRSSLSPADGYRLPTDAEWEFACRAGAPTRYFYGDSDNDLGRFAWYKKPTTITAGSLKSNAFGLFDMHGNVWEICRDFFAVEDYAGVGKDVNSPAGPASGTSHVIRGGGYSSTALLCRSASRAPFDEPRNNVGFRPALDVNFVRAFWANGKTVSSAPE